MTDRAAGCLFGLALGDALAAPVEFIRSAAEIARRFPPHGPTAPQGDPARVTDDTQMALAVGEALLSAGWPFTAASLEGPLRAAFVAWNRSPENDRAPGLTCMRACDGLARGLPWTAATVVGSKGCGANMRVAPVGILVGASDDTRAALAQFQAALTHGHPTALAASDLTARAIADLLAGVAPAALPAHLRAYAMSQRAVYHAAWLGALWQAAGDHSPEVYIARGWDECLAILDRLDAALAAPDRAIDPCLLTGEGWIAEEAFATGLLCFLLYPADPLAALRRAGVTAGDSDSIACLTGAFAGAHLGLAAWPADWLARIEYRDRLDAVSAGLGARAMTGAGPDTDALAAAGRLWLGGRPLEAGKALTALVPPPARPAWAGRIVAWATARARVTAFPEIAALVAATERGITAAGATALRDTLAATLAREQGSGRFDSLREAILVLALNAAQLLVAAQGGAPPDPRQGWWFVASLKCVGDELDDAFAADAWSLLRRFEGGGNNVASD